MKLIFITSILYAFTANLPFFKFSEFFCKNHKIPFISGSYIDLIPKTFRSQVVTDLTYIVASEVASVSKCFSINTDKMVTNIFDSFSCFKKEEVSAIYRKSLIKISSLKRLNKLDILNLSHIDLTNEAEIISLYILNDIVDYSRLSQLEFSDKVFKLNSIDLILHVEISFIYLDLQELAFLTAKDICEDKNESVKRESPDKVMNSFKDLKVSCYKSLYQKIDFYDIGYSGNRIKIQASQTGFRNSQLEVISCERPYEWPLWLVYVFGFYTRVKNMENLFKEVKDSIISDAIGHIFVCERALAELVIAIIHFNAEICKKDILYQIYFDDLSMYNLEITRIL